MLSGAFAHHFCTKIGEILRIITDGSVRDVVRFPVRCCGSSALDCEVTSMATMLHSLYKGDTLILRRRNLQVIPTESYPLGSFFRIAPSSGSMSDRTMTFQILAPKCLRISLHVVLS